VIGEVLGHYDIVSAFEDGPPGERWSARDRRDGRIVLLRRVTAPAERRDALLATAAAVAAVRHPNLARIHDFGAHDDGIWIVTDRPDGCTLADRLTHGTLPIAITMRMGLDALEALAALHRHGLTHGHLTSLRVFREIDGRILLADAGLPPGRVGAHAPSPEQARGLPPGPRSDLFALGTLMREAMTGTPVFTGNGTIERLYAVLHQDPPPLAGDGVQAVIGRILERAMRKDPSARFADAATMAAELRSVPLTRDRPARPKRHHAPRPPLRLAVLPFTPREGRKELDELGRAIADGAALTLSGTQALVVRSPFVAARYAGPPPDLAALAGPLASDLVIWGMLETERGGCRLDARLVEARSGAERARITLRGEPDDPFELQDRLAREVVRALDLPLTPRERLHWGDDVPANPGVYAAFLAARARLEQGRQWVEALHLLREAVRSDPGYAPAWVALARAHRLVAKYVLGDPASEMRHASEALARALAMRPELPAAHHVLAHHELDSGQFEAAIDRLLGVVNRNPNDPLGYAGLVAATRYAGLLDASLTAHARVMALDPTMMTSVYYTYGTLNRWEDALGVTRPGFGFDRVRALLHLGRALEARALLDRMSLAADGSGTQWIAMARAALETDPTLLAPVASTIERTPDPESNAMSATVVARAGDHTRALGLIERSVAAGYANVHLLRNDPWLAGLRAEPRFQRALDRADQRHRAAHARFARRLR
jgi:eukaryotic-like serine/threonine-protein kinase